MLKIKRIYDEYEIGDGKRILIDRLWPRGIKKEKSHVDVWAKELAPSTDLRKWFGHEPKKFSEFKKRYKKELENEKDYLKKIKNISSKNNITLLYSAKDKKYNNVVVLKEILNKIK